MLLLLLGLLAAPASCDWDYAVMTPSSLELLDGGLSPVSTLPLGIRNLSALTYDPLYYHHYFAAGGHPNASVFRVQVSRDGRIGPVEPLVKKQPEKIYGLAYDAESTTVFWTTKYKVFKSQLDLGLTDGEVVHNFEEELSKPLSIAVEPCSRYIYWSYRLNYIDRSLMDGSQKERVVEGLFLPATIYISQAERRIYWIDEHSGYSFSVGRALLDGSNKEILFEGMHQQPSSLVVSQGPLLHWTDRMTSRVYSLGTNDSQPQAVRQFDVPPFALVSAHAFKHLDQHVCPQLILMRDQVPYSAISPTAGACFHGTYSILSGSCVCNPGYIGTLCETSVCYNYCLNGGTCSLSEGKPACRCPPGRSGPRCERDSCLGSCYRGQCGLGVDGSPSCACLPGWYGPSCNVSQEFCNYACETGKGSHLSYYSCNCTGAIASALSSQSLLPFDYKLGFIVSLGACASMLLCVTLLSVRAWRLGKRPRVRRTYRVTPNKSSTAPQPVRVSPDCQIAIENCCNMNVCETPCFEPELRPPFGRSKKEEKRGLLREMEVQPDLGDHC